jgi:hypothetical protein
MVINQLLFRRGGRGLVGGSNSALASMSKHFVRATTLLRGFEEFELHAVPRCGFLGGLEARLTGAPLV